MDVRVLCVCVAVAYVDVSARITCNFQPNIWRSAMEQCLHLGGSPVDVRTVWSLTGLNGSFWTADYESRIATTDTPVECEYKTLVTGNQFSQSMFGNCEGIRNYICCKNNMIKSCVENGTWKEAFKCNETYSTAPGQLPLGDYWLNTAFGYQNYTFTDASLPNLDRCGMLDVHGHFQFVSDCVTSRYSFCEVENYTGNDLSECVSTIIAKQPSSNTPSSFVSQETETLAAIISINENTTESSVQQQTETLTTKSVSINEETSTKSIVRSHESSSSASALGIGLGISLSIVVIVIIIMVGVCVYKRRKINANCEDNRKEIGRTELGEIYVYDEISNNEELACDVSKVDIYDQIRTDRDQEHAYESVTSAPKY